ncbi:MAG TPA: hypothetical protein VFF65_13305, partial [Phycisphaerales bacterium]|nr:hypothetical protein [Phycisphaerales bacterium]
MRRSATLARWLVFAGVGVVIFLTFAGQGGFGNAGVVLGLAALVLLSVGTVAHFHCATLSQMATTFSQGRCPLCENRVTDDWRMTGVGVRCPECA